MEVLGPSMSGKSHFVGELLSKQEWFLENPAVKIYWYSPHGHLPYQISSNKNVTSILGLPWAAAAAAEAEAEDNNGEAMADESGHQIIVLDDFADLTENSKELTAIYTQHSHHKNFSIIRMSQNLFWAGKGSRTRSLNVHYLVLMRQCRDYKQIRQLARQMTQNEKQFNGFMAAYFHATGKVPYSHFLISVHPRDSQKLFLRSNLFGGNTTVYLLNAA